MCTEHRHRAVCAKPIPCLFYVRATIRCKTLFQWFLQPALPRNTCTHTIGMTTPLKMVYQTILMCQQELSVAMNRRIHCPIRKALWSISSKLWGKKNCLISIPPPSSIRLVFPLKFHRFRTHCIRCSRIIILINYIPCEWYLIRLAPWLRFQLDASKTVEPESCVRMQEFVERIWNKFTY